MHDSPPSARRLAPDAPAVGALVARAREGDREAQQELFFRHVSLVTGLIARLRPSRHDLDDLVQDTFIAAFQSIGRLSDPEAFAPWVGAIAVRTTLKHLRRHRLAARLGLAERDEIAWDLVLAPTCPPDAALELRQLYEALDTVPPRERVALILRRIEGLPLEQIAEAMEESLATVKRRIKAAEDRLRAAMDGKTR